MSYWNASNYVTKKAERLALVKPEWVPMPTGEKFYLRRVGTMLSSVLAGHMPSALTKQAVEAWKDVKDLDLNNATQIAERMSPEELSAGAREAERLSRIVQQACVIPLLSNDNPEAIEFDENWKATAIEGLKEADPDFDVATFDPKTLVLDPRDLDEADAQFLLYQWATGLVGSFSLKGGGAVNVDDLARFRKKLNRGTRTRAHGEKQRKSG